MRVPGGVSFHNGLGRVVAFDLLHERGDREYPTHPYTTFDYGSGNFTARTKLIMTKFLFGLTLVNEEGKFLEDPYNQDDLSHRVDELIHR